MVKEKVSVSVNNYEYAIETDLDPLEMQSIVRYVEDKINEAKLTTSKQGTSDILMLACLNIASENYRLKGNYENINDSFDKKADELIARIDSCLKS